MSARHQAGASAEDKALAIAASAATGLTVLFLALRLAAVTNWQWWVVFLPLICTLAGFVLIVALIVGVIGVVRRAVG